MTIVSKVEINVNKIESFIVEGGDVRIKLTSGRTLIWPSVRRKCLTITTTGKVIHDLQADVSECANIEIDGVNLEGYVTCSRCNTLHKETSECECEARG